MRLLTAWLAMALVIPTVSSTTRLEDRCQAPDAPLTELAERLADDAYITNGEPAPEKDPALADPSRLPLDPIAKANAFVTTPPRALIDPSGDLARARGPPRGF